MYQMPHTIGASWPWPMGFYCLKCAPWPLVKILVIQQKQAQETLRSLHWLLSCGVASSSSELSGHLVLTSTIMVSTTSSCKALLL